MRHIGPFFRGRGRYSNSGRPLKALCGKLLYRLERWMKVTEQTFAVKRMTMVDGTRIKLHVDLRGPMPIRRAIIVSGTTKKVFTFPRIFMESGLARMVWNTEAYYDGEMHYPADVEADVGAGMAWLDWLNVKAMKFKTRAYVAGMPSKAMTPSRYGQYGQFNNGTQSGKTLLLWQCMAGTNNAAKAPE